MCSSIPRSAWRAHAAPRPRRRRPHRRPRPAGEHGEQLGGLLADAADLVVRIRGGVVGCLSHASPPARSGTVPATTRPRPGRPPPRAGPERPGARTAAGRTRPSPPARRRAGPGRRPLASANGRSIRSTAPVSVRVIVNGPSPSGAASGSSPSYSRGGEGGQRVGTDGLAGAVRRAPDRDRRRTTRPPRPARRAAPPPSRPATSSAPAVGEDPVGDHAVDPVAEEGQRGQRAARLRDHHRLRGQHQPHASRPGPEQDLPHLGELGVQPLDRVEHRVPRHRHPGRAGQHRPERLDHPALDREHPRPCTSRAPPAAPAAAGSPRWARSRPRSRPSASPSAWARTSSSASTSSAPGITVSSSAAIGSTPAASSTDSR